MSDDNAVHWENARKYKDRPPRITWLVKVLHCIAANPGASIKQVALLLHWDKSHTHRHVKVLVDAGLVVHDRVSRTVRVSSN